MVLLLALLGPGGAKSGRLAGSRTDAGARGRAIVAAVNAVRAAHVLPGLQVDFRLARAARAHSLDMMRRGYFAHGNLLARMVRFHVHGSLFEENLVWSRGVLAAQGAVADWLASPPHRETLLDPKLRRIGVAAPVGRFDGYATATVVTADFAG
ncbi:MAG: CAP domain-containing protein [Gaiellaceae bacterium]